MRHYDLLVAGGGFSGSAATVAAARRGLKVLLVERANCLGGAATNCLVGPFMKYWTHQNGSLKKLSRGIFEEIAQELLKMDPEVDGGSLTPGHFSEESLKLLLNRMLLEAGAEMLFNTQMISAECENGRISNVTLNAFGKTFQVSADYYIDATGDGNLSVCSGFAYQLGREGDSLCQPMTLCFRLAGVDTKRFFGLANREAEDQELNRGAFGTDEGCSDDEKNKVQFLYKQWQKAGKIKNPREDVMFFRHVIDGVVHFNTTRVVRLDPTDPFDVSRAEIEAREQAWEMYGFLRKNIASFKNSKIVMTAPHIGTRESRKIECEYRLTEEDIKSCKKFDDTVAVGNYDIDIHNPEGAGTSHYFFPQGKYYSIPYRSLVPKGAKNLLVAGRCIGVDHAAQASIRIMPIVCTIGEAAGTAVAVAKSGNTDVMDTDVGRLQKLLIENGAVIE